MGDQIKFITIDNWIFNINSFKYARCTEKTLGIYFENQSFYYTNYNKFTFIHLEYFLKNIDKKENYFDVGEAMAEEERLFLLHNSKEKEDPAFKAFSPNEEAK